MKNAKTQTFKAIAVQYLTLIESFRFYRANNLKTFIPALASIEAIREYAERLSQFSLDLKSLCYVDPAQRFATLRHLCRTGYSLVFFPEYEKDMDKGNVVFLVFDDEELLGTLIASDLSY